MTASAGTCQEGILTGHIIQLEKRGHVTVAMACISQVVTRRRSINTGKHFQDKHHRVCCRAACTFIFNYIPLAISFPINFFITMDNYTKRLVLCFSEKLDQAKVGYIEWDSFKLMAMVRLICAHISREFFKN